MVQPAAVRPLPGPSLVGQPTGQEAHTSPARQLTGALETTATRQRTVDDAEGLLPATGASLAASVAVGAYARMPTKAAVEQDGEATVRATGPAHLLGATTSGPPRASQAPVA